MEVAIPNPCLICRCPCKQFEIYTRQLYEEEKEKEEIVYRTDDEFFYSIIKKSVCRWCLHEQEYHKK